MTFPNYENSEQIDQAQAQIGADGKRTFETDHKFRVHLEAERVRLAEGRPVPTPEKPSTVGVSFTGPNGQRDFKPGEAPDPRLHELANALQARIGPDGRRMYDSDPTWRASVEKSRQEVQSGTAKWSAASAAMLENLQAEARGQAADSRLYPGSERVSGFVYDRTDPQWQSAAAKANELGLSDEQFRGLMAWQAQQQEGGK